MPRGVYLRTPGSEHHVGWPAPVREAFACAAGPAGWRYTAERTDGSCVDLSCDTAGRLHRVVLGGPAGELRGGGLGSRLVWSGPDGREHDVAAVGLAGDSPAGVLALVRLLGPDLAAAPGRPLTVTVVAVSLPTVATLSVRQAWSWTGRELHGRLTVDTYTVDDLDTGGRAVLHVAGDVLLAADGPAGAVELLELDGPPNL